MPPMPMGPDPMMEQPPMDASQDGEPMGNEEMGDDEEGGVGSDVKKYSGELSQALNSYNEENPNDEEKLNKYAANMIAAQVASHLTDKDKRSVIKKIQGDDDDDDMVSDGMSPDEQPQADMQAPMPQMEGRIVSEIADELLNGRKRTTRDEKKITNKKITKHNPFVSNR